MVSREDHDRVGHAKREGELHVRRLAGRGLLGKVGILVAVDEQETGPITSRSGRETSQQQGTVAADDQREMPVVDDRRDRVPDPCHQQAESPRIDDVDVGVTFRRRGGQCDLPVVVHVRVLPDGVDEAVLPQDRQATRDAVDPSRASSSVHRGARSLAPDPS